MSAKMESAFNMVINLQGRVMTLERRGGLTVSVKAAPANYFRNLASVEEIIEEGSEFIISKKMLDAVSYPEPRRGDVLIDVDLGPKSITEVRPMFVLGQLFGYRLRTG